MVVRSDLQWVETPAYDTINSLNPDDEIADTELVECTNFLFTDDGALSTVRSPEILENVEGN
jgi:hypothetical protein